jgi:hypothetical protein
MAKIQWLYGMGLPIPATHEEVAEVYGKHTGPFRARDVYAALKINGTTIPADMEGTFEVAIEGSAWHRAYAGKMIVRPATGAYAKHRIFVPCSCGAEVPFGRIAQHKCK